MPQLLASPPSKARVLVVDDLDINRMIVRGTLASHYDVDVVEDGEAAVRAATGTLYDLILMDINLPGADGFVSSSQIRSLGGEAATTKIVALSVQPETVLRANAHQAGMDDVIARPIGPAALIKRVAQILAAQPTISNEMAVWNRSQFDDFAARLGEERMLGYLRDFEKRLKDLVAGLSRGTIPLATIPARVHDLRSIAGMFGFEELLGVCSAIQTDDAEPSLRGHLLDLSTASRRAIAAIRSTVSPDA